MNNKKKENELLAMARQAINKAQAKSLIKDLKDEQLNIVNSAQKKNLILKKNLENNDLNISDKLKNNIEIMQDSLDDFLVELTSDDVEISALTTDAKNAINILRLKNPKLASNLENSISLKNRKKSKIINKQRI